jgi:predicted porin
MKAFSIFFILLFAAGFFGPEIIVKRAFGQDNGKVQELQRVIEAQQKQLEMQQQQLDAQRELLQELQTRIDSLAKDTDEKFKTVVEEDKTAVQEPVDKVVTSGQERVKLSISGHVSRAVNIVDDGKETDAYFVDNDNSESRVNFVGIARINDDLTLGSRIELTIAPNKASSVDQNEQETGDVFEQRWTEISLASKSFGKVSLGKGFTASYGMASADLSGTNVIATSTIVDLAGGMLFRQKSDDSLTDLRVNFAFSDFNGLSRKNRLRYDSPKFLGAHLSTSLISDERYDGVLHWGGQGYGFKAAGSVGFADPNEDDADLLYAGSFAILHDNTGLNLSLSAGKKERDSQDDATNIFVKAGWLTKFFAVGKTAFSVDYTKGDKFPTENDDGYSIGVAAVQQFEKYGTEIFAIYRKYSLDRDVEPEVHDINVVSSGARVKF